MGALSWFRVARRVVGLPAQPEYPNLEALLEAEEGQIHSDYNVLARIVPALVVGFGFAAFVPLALRTHNPFLALGGAAFAALAFGLKVLFDRLDKSISPSKRQIRQLSALIWERYRRLGNLVGVEPALAPPVAQVLDEAAGIYLKHTATLQNDARQWATDSERRAALALEEAMAKILELAKPASVRTQELDLSAGWAMPLLSEMRQMDAALGQHLRTVMNSQVAAEDPLARLREARQELMGVDDARRELEQKISE